MTISAQTPPVEELSSTETLLDVPIYVYLYLAGFVFSMFSGNTQYLGLPLSLDRPLYLLATLLLLLDHRTERLRFRPVYAVMAATLVWTALSWIDTGNLRDTDKAFALADRIGLPFVMFALGSLAFSTPVRRDLLLKVLTVLGIYLALTGIFEFAGVDSLVWPRYISDPALGIQQGRARGPFLSSEPFGMTNGLVVFAAAVLAARTRGSWRLVAVLTVVACSVGVTLSLTRSTWIGAALGAIVIMSATPRLRRWLPIGAGGVVAVGAGLLAALPSVHARITERLDTTNSVYDRLNTNAAALRVLQAHPLTGVGWGNFRAVAANWIRQSDTYPLSNSNIEVHNVFLSRAAETGYVGAALWALAMLLGPVRALIGSPAINDEVLAWKLFAVGALCIWIVPSLTSPNPYPLPNLLIWLVGGIAGRRYLVTKRPALVPDPTERASS